MNIPEMREKRIENLLTNLQIITEAIRLEVEGMLAQGKWKPDGDFRIEILKVRHESLYREITALQRQQMSETLF